MQLKSVETTPNPNSIKLNLNGSLGATTTYTAASSDCPEAVGRLLAVEGIKSVFVCNDFITLNRDPRTDWRLILEQATAILGVDGALSGEAVIAPGPAAVVPMEGQVQIYVQTFRGIPIQVKAVDLLKEVRISLGDRFNEAAQLEQAKSGADFLKERYWADHGVRYGPLEEVANDVAEELKGTFERSYGQAKGSGATALETSDRETLALWLQDQDWHQRLAAVQELSLLQDNVEDLSLALKDSNAQVRRLAAAALGTTGSAAAVAPLAHALVNDSSIGVRRTAGDALSDLGDVAAQEAICKALGDANKLVRWRAARFLSDVGTAEALPFLTAAKEDSEFEVRLEIEAAIQRISGGAQGIGPAWKRIIGQN
jgi:hypothetical protein